ncbi:MAG: 2-C-methyl-D-erythritol 2,4-cyclodiphosphate synthase [Clostridiales bacterium]|nr:2-C-methyl-D-erythritol 2,4-cyclodiphosphate synthase [Clostridiales bacterium]
MKYAIIVAAGSGSRMGMKKNKVLLPLGKIAVIAHSVKTFLPLVEGVFLVTKEEEKPLFHKALQEAGIDEKKITYIRGGQTRQASVQNALMALPKKAREVAIHDGARPFVSPQLITKVFTKLIDYPGVIPGIKLKDTVKKANDQGIVTETVPRDELVAIQTPQGFWVDILRKAYEHGEKMGLKVTDDSSLLEAMGEQVLVILGEEENIKITTPADWEQGKKRIEGRNREASKMETSTIDFRIGQGTDVHRLVEGRPLILCGVTIPYEKGLLGHSDADVAAHALTDALLGACALGDIGALFPDSDKKYLGADSLSLLHQAMEEVAALGYQIVNADITIVAQNPKLAPYIVQMRRNIAASLQLSIERISVKATTSEGLGFEGEGKGISAQAVCLLEKTK